MARAPGLRIVAEGVENWAQVEILRELGADDVQGYYYGRRESPEASVARVIRRMTALPGAGDLIAIEAATTPANSEDSLRPSSVQQLP